MANEQIFQTILPLIAKLKDCVQKEFGWIYSKSSHLVTHPDNEIRKLIQTRVDASVQGLLLIYLFAMWEEYVPRPLEKEWLPADSLQRLNAFRHLRHSVAHGFDGKRANKFRQEFELEMNSQNAFPNLPWDNDSIDLTKSQVAIDCQRLMEQLSSNLIGRIANDNRP